MTTCKSIGCTQATYAPHVPFCEDCSRSHAEYPEIKETSSGRDNDYWLVDIKDPKRLDPYTVECEDLIEALEMTFQEGEAFKAIFRKCKARLGEGKPGDTPLRNAEKVAHFGSRMEVMEHRKLQCKSTSAH